MTFDDVLGHEPIKKYLKSSVDAGRVAHAQMFVGTEGSGTLPMAIAYASYLLCGSNNEACSLKCQKLSHPDLHFAYPVATTTQVKKDPVSSSFYKEWTDFVEKMPYGSLFDWYLHIGIEKKQGIINVNEAKEITNKLTLKAYEGGYKIMIIWMAERMNTDSANKLLKLLEEPPQQTVFILIAEDESAILDTIRSRCQTLHFPPMSEQAIKDGLVANGIDENKALKIAVRSQGNYNKAWQYVNETADDEHQFEKWFIAVVRTAFRARGNKAAIHGLLQWSDELSMAGREVQKQFLLYAVEVFRQAMLLNYGMGHLVYLQFHTENFEFAKFAPFVHGNNIQKIYENFEEANANIERNGNAKIIFTDLSIKLTHLLHTPKV
ncbi:MAG: DNA polymerase III subunit delta' [Capnocytophaga sp.]|nr:DNA polymerase III subunit delta' [Capnocytophaga sp.]